MAPPSKGKRRQVAALHSALVICPSFARILTRTFKLHPSSGGATERFSQRRSLRRIVSALEDSSVQRGAAHTALCPWRPLTLTAPSACQCLGQVECVFHARGIGLPIRPWTLVRKDLELLEFRQLTRVRWIGTAIALAGIWLFTSLKFGPERCLERHRTAAAAPEVPPVPGRGSEQGAGLWFASEAHSGLQLE